MRRCRNKKLKGNKNTKMIWISNGSILRNNKEISPQRSERYVNLSLFLCINTYKKIEKIPVLLFLTEIEKFIHTENEEEEEISDQQVKDHAP